MRNANSAMFRLLIAVAGGLAMSLPAIADVITGVDEQARLPFWEWQSEGMSVRLVQRLPDQSRAFFMARGFSTEDAELIAQSCVFQTVYKNVSDTSARKVIEYDLSAWRVVHAGKTFGPRLREDWAAEWQKRKVKPAAQIAFEWALLPTRQRYEAGDYNWGMTMYGLPPGTEFDLELVWKTDGKTHTGRIEKLQCAPDIHPGPETARE